MSAPAKTALERLGPRPFPVGVQVNVDGIGANLTVIAVKPGARVWSVEVRRDDSATWNVPASRCWREDGK